MKDEAWLEEATCGKVEEIRVWATVLAVEIQVENFDLHHHVVGVVGSPRMQLPLSATLAQPAYQKERHLHGQTQSGNSAPAAILPSHHRRVRSTRTTIEALAWRHVAGKQMLVQDARNVSLLACIRWHPSGYFFYPEGTYLIRLAQHESRRGAVLLREARAGLQHRQPGKTSSTKRDAETGSDQTRAREETSASSDDDSVRWCEPT